MKKLITLFLLTLLLLLPVVALAEGELPTEPFTWQYLATIIGATAATLLIVQLCKFPLDKVWKIPTRFVVYFISLIIIETATYFTSGLDASSAILNILNAGIIALAAMGAYEMTFRKVDEKKTQPPTE